jgi:transglutaminase-like putative cysteine protease
MRKKTETSRVYQISGYPHVIYPLGVKSIASEYHAEFEVDPAIEKIYSVDDWQSIVLPSYSVTFEKVNYRMSDLTSAVGAAGVNRDFISRYTQLPASMPKRVGDLAKEITAGKDNWYDKAKAIEQYLKGSDFSYDTKDVLIPGEKDDYIDQFLFESKRGYCDNFSTSMTAMLRTLDIPARWVKGYTAGEFSGSDGQLRKYEITNDNAHSWVEVYFPDAGWVAFEPTPGFTNHVQYQSDEEAANATGNVEEEPVQEQPELNQESEQSQQEDEKDQTISSPGGWHHLRGITEHYWKWAAAAGIAAGILVFFLFRTRVKWLPYFYIWRFKHLTNTDVFPEAFMILLKQLQRSGLKRKAGQTLREYALVVDKHFSTDEMTRLTDQYEQYLYGNGKDISRWSEMKELWEYLIKRTIA